MGCKKIFEDRNIFSDKLEIEIFDELLTELGIMLKCGKTVVLAFINFVKLTNQDYNIIYKERYSAAGIMPVQFAIQDDYSKQKNEYLAEIIKMQLKPFLIFNHQTFEITILVESISADFPASILAMNAAAILCYICELMKDCYIAFNIHILDEQPARLNNKFDMLAQAQINLCVGMDNKISFLKLRKLKKIKRLSDMIFQSFDNKFCEYFKMLEELKNHISRYWSLRGKYLHSDKFEKQRKIKICSYKKLDISNNLELIKNDNVIVCKYIDCYSDAITSITEIPSPLIEAPRSEHHYKLSSKISYTKTLEKYYKQIVSPSGVRNLKIYAIINTLQNDDKNIIASNSFCEQIVEDIISTIVSEKINEFNIVLRITAEYFGSTNNLIICAIINFLNILRAYKLSEKFAKLFENDFWCREYYYNADCGITEKTEESSYYSLSCVSKKNLNFCILTALTDQRIDINGLQKIFENTIDDLINEKKDIYEQIKNSKLIFD